MAKTDKSRKSPRLPGRLNARQGGRGQAGARSGRPRSVRKAAGFTDFLPDLFGEQHESDSRHRRRVMETLAEDGVKPAHVEATVLEWILIDCFGLVVPRLRDTRAFYDLSTGCRATPTA